MKREWAPLFAAISTSEKVASLGQACGTLGQDSAALFFTWLIPHCDSWGRIEASARVLTAKVWPMAGHTPDETEACVKACEKCGLLEVRSDANSAWIQVLDWDNKAGSIGQLVRDRGASKFPAEGKPRVTLGQAKAKPAQRRAEQRRSEESRLPPQGAAVVVVDPVKVNGVHQPAPTSPHHAFIAFWMDAFLAAQGRAYGFDDGKDGKQVQAILKLAGGSLDLAKERALLLLHAAPEWIDESGRDLCTLRSQWNKLVSMGTGRTSGSKQLAIHDAIKPGAAPSGLLNMPTAKRA